MKEYYDQACIQKNIMTKLVFKKKNSERKDKKKTNKKYTLIIRKMNCQIIFFKDNVGTKV